MSRRYLNLLLLIFAIAITTTLPAKESKVINYRISKLANIPQNDINDMYQDSRGFIWIGTLDGLHCYDGYGFKTYRVSDDKNAINSNIISSIAEDSLGNIWIATYDKGLCKLNTRTSVVTNYTDKIASVIGTPIYDINVIHIDPKGVLWIVSKRQVVRMELDSDFEEIVAMETLFETNIEAHAVYTDSRGQLWLCAANRLIQVVNPHASKGDIDLEIYDMQAQDICESEDELIVLGANLHILERDEQGDIQRNSMKTYQGINGNSVLYYDNRIWTGNQRGVVCYDRDADAGWVQNDTFNGNFKIQGMGSNSVFSMMMAPDIGIWVGTRGSGINVIDLNPKPFKHYKHTFTDNSLRNDIVKSVFQDSYDQVWIGTEGKFVNLIEAEDINNFDSSFKHISVNPSGVTDGVYSIDEMFTPDSQESKSIIWLGTSYYTGLVGMNPHTRKIIHTLNQVGYAYTVEVDDLTLWVGTYRSGLWKFEFDTKGELLSSKQFMPNSYKGSVTSDIIRHIFKDSKGYIWIGTDKGLNRLSPQEAAKSKPQFEDCSKMVLGEGSGADYILQIFEDRGGRIWIGTMGQGLLYCIQSPNYMSFRRITTKEGLPNNTIKSIVEAEDGSLWLATNNGISQLNAINRMIINYNTEDGLQANEFSEACATRLRDGRIIMGGINGFNIFAPEDIQPDTTPLKLYITDLYINNRLVKAKQRINGRELIENNIDFTDKIELKSYENNIALSFIGIHHNAPNKNNYEYKLEGFDKEWIHSATNVRTANYTNIPAGDYVFKVRCHNIENAYDRQTAQLAIHIEQPFYFKWIAFVIYFVLISLITFVWVRFKRNKDEEKHKLLVAELEKKQVEELAQVRQQFFMNISHEFKTPLTLIKGYLDRLLTAPDASMEDRVKNCNMINWNVRVMMRLISQLMDFRRLDQNRMELKFAEVEVNEFVYTIYSSFESWTDQKSIVFGCTRAAEPINTTLDANKMEIILFNILSNAIKYTPDNGKIDIVIATQGDNYTISISDTGIGIPEKDHDRIFERFFQSSDKNRIKAGGTGIGLAHAKSLVEKVNGSIGFTSREGEGTTFTITMPIRNEVATVERKRESNIIDDINMEREKLSRPDYERPEVISPDKKTLLIVEDNSDLRIFIANELSDKYNVITAEDGQVGYDKAREHNPDLIVSDVMMPNMDGIEMCQAIKGDEQTSHIPIILLTAKTSEESKIKGYNSNADAYLTKPFSRDLLRERIKAILHNRESLKTQYQKEIKINPMIITNSDVDVTFMERMLEIMENNLSNPNFNVEKMAQEYGVSRTYLTRKIKALTGESAIQFQRSIRLKHAVEYLIKSDLTISEIAWKVGYNDIDTFRSRFKEQFNLNPSEYRLQNRPNCVEEQGE